MNPSCLILARARNSTASSNCSGDVYKRQEYTDLMEMHILELSKLPSEEKNETRSEEHTSELQSHYSISYAVFCLKKKGYIKANTAWTERFQELTEVSNTLYKILEYENARKLNKDKFHRYTSLHFRSVILGNLA